MKLLRFLTTCCMIGFLFWNANSASAEPRDYTTDYEDSFETPAFMDAVAADQGWGDRFHWSTASDPWTGFLARLPGFSRVTWGMEFLGKAPLDKNQSTPMVPASVQKIVTAASALRNLGATTRYANYFEARFQAAAHTASNVKFTVSGDPTWGHSEYEPFNTRMNLVIAQLKSKEIHQVTGAITVVSTRPELDQLARPSGWPARWTLQCMATLPSSFMMNGNCGQIRITSPHSAGWMTPGVDLPIHLQVSSGTRNNLILHAEQDSGGRIVGYTISGQFRSATSIFRDPNDKLASISSVPVQEGTRWLKNLFIHALAQNGIAYDEKASAVGGSPLYVDLSSQPLKDVLRIAVQKSINGIMDRTFYEIAHSVNAASAHDPSLQVLHEVIADDSLLNGVEILDGSGLIVTNRLRADTVHRFLKRLQLQPYFSDFLSLLSVSGEVGTLENRLNGPLTRGRIYGKTGTIDEYYNLVGYYKTSAQTFEPFAVFSSSHLSARQVRGIIDQVVTRFAGLQH